MSTFIQFHLTQAGLNAALDAQNNGLTLNLNKIVFGTGKYISVDNDPRTALITPIAESQITTGGIEPATHTLVLSVMAQSPSSFDASEIGIFTETGVLFAVASVNSGYLIRFTETITFVGSFGMSLTAIPNSNVQVMVSNDGPLSQLLMTTHEVAANPHPQYQQQLNAHDLELQDIKRLLDNLYPRVVMSGVFTGNNQTIDVSEKITDLRDSKYQIFISPESEHEGWELTRNAQNLYVSVYDRSGTNRIGYNGQVSWSIVQATSDNLVGGNGDYTAVGTYTIPVLPNETKQFILVSGGGAGGGFVWEAGDRTGGGPGESTTLLDASNILAKVFGGGGGPSGQWSNGSYFNEGAESDPPGSYQLSNDANLISFSAGNYGGKTMGNHSGGVSVSPVSNWGKGGNGSDGGGDNGHGFGTGGSSGSCLFMTYTNNAAATKYLSLTIGAGGTPFVSNGGQGSAGTNGFARVSTVS